jgi:hypothetical protein
MKQAISVLLLIGLMAIPIGCVLAQCPAADHQCCPKSDTAVSTCAFDILSAARTSATSLGVTLSAAIVPLPVVPLVYDRAIFPAISLLRDSGDLHIVNRVLLI